MKSYRYLNILMILILSPAAVIYAGSERDFRQAAGITGEDIRGARSKKELSLFDVYALAVANTEQLAIQGEYTEQADARRDRAYAAWFPRISLKAAKKFPEPKGTATSEEVSLYARQNFITGLDEWSSIKGSRAETVYYRMQFQHAATQYLGEIASAYYRVIAIEKKINNNTKIISHYKGVYQELGRRVAVGRSRRSELLRITAQINKLEGQLAYQKNELSRARRSLSDLTGIEDAAVLIEQEFPDYDISKAADIDSLVEARYDVKAAAEDVKIAGYRVLAARGGHLPSVYAEGSYSLYGKNSSGNDYQILLGAEIPIFSGGSVSAKVRETESMKRQSEMKLSRTRRLARAEITEARRSYTGSLEETAAFRKALESAEADYRQLTAEYRLNLVTLLDVFNSLAVLESARDEYEAAVISSRLYRIKLGISVNEFSGANIVKIKTGGK